MPLAGAALAVLVALAADRSERVTPEERAVLIEIFEATGGPQWKDRSGWLGPEGTECSWHGVQCYPDEHQVMHVSGLSLEENKLTGSIPTRISSLPHLYLLWTFGNSLGPMPPEVLARWDTGLLDLRAGGRATDVDEIRLDYDTTVLCTDYHVVIRRDGAITHSKEECRGAKAGTRPKTYCRLKTGRVWDYDRLARAAQVFAEPPVTREPGMGTWFDVPITTVTIVRGERRTIVRSGPSPPPLRHWVLESAVASELASAEWTSTSEQPECPKP